MPIKYQNIDDPIKLKGQTRAERYKSEDIDLMPSINGQLLNPEFGKDPGDRVELHIYDISGKLISSDHNVENFSVALDKDKEQSINLTLATNLKKLNFEKGAFTVAYNFFRDRVGAPNLESQFYVQEISDTRDEIRIVPTVRENPDKKQKFYGDYEKFSGQSKSIPFCVGSWVDLIVNFGKNNVSIASGWEVDDVTTATIPRSIVLKLYEPLPPGITKKQKCWLSTEIAPPVVERINLVPDSDFRLKQTLRPNFDLCLDTTPRVESDYRSWNDLLGTDNDTSQEIINTTFSSSLQGIPLNIDYSIFENYIHFSSAEERIKNFKYKLQLIGQYDKEIRKYNGGEEWSGSYTNQTYVNNYQKKFIDLKYKVLNGFDDFEKWVYYDSGSNDKYITTTGSMDGGLEDWTRSVIAPYPKISGSYKNDNYESNWLSWEDDDKYDWALHSAFLPGRNYELFNLTSSAVSTWYNAAIASASAYDKSNQNNLIYTMPEYLREGGGQIANETYGLFLNMIGHHYDLLWTYIKHLSDRSNRKHDEFYEKKKGLHEDILYHVAKSYGMNLVDGDPNQELWYYLLGKNETGFHQQATGSLQTMSSKERTSEVWRRIINNLPFLLKSKGTSRGIRALINCYGVPSSILRIREYGSSIKGDQSAKYITDDFTYVLNLQASESISTPWKPHQKTIGYVTSSAVYPNAIEFRFNPRTYTGRGIPTEESQSLWQVENRMGLVLHRSQSSTFSYPAGIEGLTEFGYVKFVVSSSDGYVSSSTNKIKIFDESNETEGEGWCSIVLNRHATDKPWKYGQYHTSSKFTYEVMMKRANYGTIDQIATSSLSVTGSDQLMSGTGFSSSINNSWSSGTIGTQAYLGGWITSSAAGVAPATVEMYKSPYSDPVFGQLFSGSVADFRYWAMPLSESTFNQHVLAPHMYNGNNETSSYDDLLVRLRLNDSVVHYSGSNRTGSSPEVFSSQPDQRWGTWDAAGSYPISGTVQNGRNTINYKVVNDRHYTDTPEIGPNMYTSDKIRVQTNQKKIKELHVDGRAVRATGDEYSLDTNEMGVYFSPTDLTNTDIFNHVGGINLDDYIGDPRHRHFIDYPDLKSFAKKYFKKYSNKENDSQAYLNILKNYDMSLFTMIKQMLPARANADVGIVIEPHVLERSKTPPRKIRVLGSGKTQQIIRKPADFKKIKAPTLPTIPKPQVQAIGPQIDTPVLSASLSQKTPKANPVKIEPKRERQYATLKTFKAEPQFGQVDRHQKQTHDTFVQNSVEIVGTIGTNDDPFILIGNQLPTQKRKGFEAIKQRGQQTKILSHEGDKAGSLSIEVSDTISLGLSVSSSKYSYTQWKRKFAGTGAPAYGNLANGHYFTGEFTSSKTPDWKASPTGAIIETQRYSRFKDGSGHARMSSRFFYSSSFSASLGSTHDRNGTFVYPMSEYAYSQSLHRAEISDYNLEGTTAQRRLRYEGCKISGLDFNAESLQTDNGSPVVTINIVDPNKLVTNFGGFEGDLSIR